MSLTVTLSDSDLNTLGFSLSHTLDLVNRELEDGQLDEDDLNTFRVMRNELHSLEDRLGSSYRVR